MAQLIVRNIEDAVKDRLAERGRRHGRSMEEEVRGILRAAVREDTAARQSEGVAHAAAKLAGKRNQHGREVEMRDTFIAGICLSRKARLATRNMRDFFDAGLSLIDPWKEGAKRP
jgi:plasmid stability protein